MSQEIIIRPKPDWKLIDLFELWRYRELLYIFTWRDIKVRYKQTVLGILWVIFQPLVTTFIFTFFFGRLAKISSGELPYSLFSLCGIIFWTFYSSGLSHASNSMVANENIIKKVYFPKILLPLSSILTSLVDFNINIVLLLILSLYLGYIPHLYGFLIFPLSVGLTMITSFGLGLILASVNVKYRDVSYILPFFIQILLFITPVIYPLSIVSEKNRIIMALNPMSAVVELARFSLNPKYAVYPNLIIISVISSIIIVVIGLWYFRRTEKFFADIV